MALAVDGEVIVTTEDHPFWSVTDQRFERTDELSAGELVLSADGSVVRVVGLRVWSAHTGWAYNLSVPGIHTYHVGHHEILVHNTGMCNLDKAFRFPGAGRSGVGVKDFVGPPNSVARGATPRRVFQTDEQGRVILDITRERVQPVVPGQGFVRGDGRKLAPTSEQLGWIDELWGP